MSSIYIHIPFCSSICSYCDFVKVYYRKDWANQYLDNLEKEIQASLPLEPGETLYIGGGTPSCLSEKQLYRLLEMVQPLGCVGEFTMECNPESLTYNKLRMMKEMGVNRLSIGVQSFQDELLSVIGRRHTARDVFACIEQAHELGFDNISIDMMYNLPHQTMELFNKDIEILKTLDIQHLSYYSLILEEGTILSYQKYQLEDDYVFSEALKHASLPWQRYEISNYAYPGYESKHNLVYWHNEHYLSFGLGAHGYQGNERYYHTSSLTEYLKGNYLAGKEILTLEDRMFEEIMLGLRLVEGISIEHFEKKFQQSILVYKEAIEKNIQKGYLMIEDNYLKATELGIDWLDSILIDFIK